MVSPYDVLGLPPTATTDEVVAAYRARVKEVHPDLGGSREEFKIVQRAYEVLLTEEETGMEGRDSPISATVEYLNYDVIADTGVDIADAFDDIDPDDYDPADYGTFTVRPPFTLLEAAENADNAWPFACRGGACANCAVAVVEGDISQPPNHILPDDLLEANYRLSCIGYPLTDRLRVVYNVKHKPSLEALTLPPYPFTNAYQKQ